MNSRTPLILSLELNLGLLAVVSVVMKNRPTPDASPASPGAVPADAKTNLRKTSSVQRTITVRTNTLDWRTVESGDYKEYIANLRSIGCPEETIRDIIIADVNKLFEDRKKALKKPVEPFKFWETGNKGMQKMLGGIRAETERGMADTLGKTGFQSYKNGNTAWWLNSLNPEQPQPTSKP